jgi:hypothetical protein
MAITTASLLFSTSAAALTTFQIAVGGLLFSGVSMLVTAALTPKPKIPNFSGSNISVSMDPIGAADIIYGEIRKAGTKTYHETNGGTKFYHYFLTFAMHEVEEIGDIYVNDEIATIDANGYVTQSTNANNETRNWGSKILIKKFLGTADQDIYSSLASLNNGPSGITTDFKGRNVACLYVRLNYDKDIFKNGAPLITAVVKGKKLYDPRKDNTSSAYDASLGVSNHRKTNAATWQYSSNPALAIRDYLTSNQGVQAAQSEIDDNMIAEAADACATTGVSGAIENSFSIDGSVSCAGTKLQNLNDMIKTINGSLFYGQGKFRLVAGAYRAPDFATAFTLDDIRGPINIKTRFSRRDLVNTVRGTFVNRDNRWIADEFPQVQLQDMSEDNDVESILNVDMPLVTKPAAAQRLAKQILYTNREQIILTARFSAKAYKVQVGDNIKLTMDRYGWTNKEFRVMRWKRVVTDEGVKEVELTLQETSSTAYQWSISADEYREMIANNSSLDSMSEGLSISNFTLTSPAPVIQADGTAAGRLAATWSAPTNASITHYEVEWKNTGSVEYNATTTQFTSIAIEPLIVGQTYTVRVRAITTRGNAGAYVSANKLVDGDTTAPGVASITDAIGGYRTATLRWTNPVASDFAYVEIYRLESGTYTLRSTSAGSSWTDAGLSDATSYSYKLKAVDWSGNKSDFSNVGTATTNAQLVDGSDAKLLTLTATGQAFTYNSAGTASPTSQTITFTADLQGTQDTSATFSTSPTVSLGGTGNTRTLSIANFGTNDSVTVTATADSGAATDKFTVYRLQDGATGANGVSALSIIMSNEAHTVPAQSDGTVISYANSGTTIRVYEGTTELDYDGVGTTNSTWNVTATGSGITAGSKTDSGSYVTINNHSAMSADLATVTYAISGKRSDGTAFTATKIQSITKSKQGASVSGPRGAGRWTINVDTLPTTSSQANTAFVSAIGSPVNLDQAWFVRNADFKQSVWLYTSSNSTWTEQTEVIDGSLLVSGTLTADMIQSGTLDASKVTIKDLTINDTLQLQAGGAGFIGGRTSNSAYDQDGFYIARTDKGGGSLGFEVSHTSVRNSKIEGIVHKDDSGLQIYNPTFFSGGSSTGGTSLITTSTSVNAGENENITVSVIGGGGGGGYGRNDGYGSGTAGAGGTTTLEIRAGSATGTIIATITASGGAGGRNAVNQYGGGAGQASTFGAGGASAANNAAANSAPATSYGAGGGGAGGDAPSTFDSSGGGGEGGFAAQLVTQTVDCSAYAGQDIWLVTTIGAGGAGGTGGSRNGGAGASGAVQYSSLLGGTSQSTLAQMVNRQIGPITTTTSVTSSATYTVISTGIYVVIANLYIEVTSGPRGATYYTTYAFQYSVNGGGWSTLKTERLASGSHTIDFAGFVDLSSAATVRLRFLRTSDTNPTVIQSTSRLLGPFV